MIKQFYNILQKALDQQPLQESELEILLNASGTASEELYATARKCRAEHFGNRLFGYGFIYFSTHCRNNCTFCGYRCSNHGALRYRKTREEILALAREFRDSGVHLLDLTMGEDPVYMGNRNGFETLLEIAAECKDKNDLPLMLSPGVLDKECANMAAKAGVDFYACYQETHNLQLFDHLRSGQEYDFRFLSKHHAQNAGMLIEEGILAGVGETLADIAHSISLMQEMNAHQVRVMSFVPQQGAPLEAAGVDDLYRRELNTLAVMRLVMPDRFIPASLDIAGKAGLRERLNAGANIVTSIIVPQSGLAGVSNATLDVDSGERSLQGIMDTVEECGLQMGTKQEFTDALNTLRKENEYRADSDCWRAAAGS